MLYHWNKVKSLARYANGDIVVSASNLKEAKKIAKEKTTKFFKERYDYWDIKGADSEFWQEVMEILEEDLKKEPIQTECVCILGSE